MNSWGLVIGTLLASAHDVAFELYHSSRQLSSFLKANKLCMCIIVHAHLYIAM